jgi:hypothetical protein
MLCATDQNSYQNYIDFSKNWYFKQLFKDSNNFKAKYAKTCLLNHIILPIEEEAG